MQPPVDLSQNKSLKQQTIKKSANICFVFVFLFV